ncbi:MAG: hypothetical protein IKQ43_04230 [Treponema sp.]|nr:hypothetical protein [Treponema sp.]MBR7080757.1 hypothetical protein [Treponema sp.]
MEFDRQQYLKILCGDYPDFLDDYIQLPLLQRLSGVGLLCGTDWTPLFHNQFYYSRLEHSIGVALIVWNFTHDKKQTIAGLFHDVATPAFSHVVDFQKGDVQTQESTEKLTSRIINDDIVLSELLFSQGIYKYEIDDYHQYPIADNNIPGLSADRLEYMFPSGAALDGIWEMSDIKDCYSQIRVLANEVGQQELGFISAEAALEYTKKFLKTSMILQHNEDKVAMQLMADVLSRAMECGFIDERDLLFMNEEYLITKFEGLASRNLDPKFTRLFRTFRNMKTVMHTFAPIEDAYCVSLDVKKRFVDPLVQTAGQGSKRLSQISSEGEKCIHEFLAYKDTPYGCVKWVC